jgi:alkanesulfonate monooxygenase SsuD/methylene tetrahydromethanopterin reductase-like flavin-dependent oxidoreductase (luciferase family)
MAMSVKAIVQLYPTLPVAPAASRAEGRPHGRDRERYQAVLRDWAKVAKAAEDMGYWGIATIEHHFHSEGYEIAPAPGVINAWLGAHTSKINIGTIGYPMGTHDAIRVAEETAVLDHLLEGRFWMGASRGYQSRWTDVMGQYHGAQATLSDGSETDAMNRRVFEEQMEIMLAAWTRDSFAYDGEFSQVPFPFETGIVGYPAADTAALFGADGEVDDHGTLRKVSVVPSPFQRPHPPVFVAASNSDESIRYCARNGFVVCHFCSPQRTIELAQIYEEEASACGHPLRPGDNQAPVRWPHIASNAAEFDRKLVDYDADIFENFYAKFFKKKLPIDGDIVSAIKDSGLYLGGTVDQAKAQFSAEWNTIPYEYSILIWHWALQPTDDLLREMEMLATHVFPEVGGMAPPEERPRAQWALERISERVQ